MVALCLGLYTRWAHSEDLAILIIAFFGLFVFAISCALIYYFSMEEIGFSLSRLWIGCLLGVVSFTDQGFVRYALYTSTYFCSVECEHSGYGFWCIFVQLLFV